MDKMTRAQAVQIFTENAFLMGLGDGIPADTVVDLLGKDALDHVKSRQTRPGMLWNRYGIGDRSIDYLTLPGFMMAVTYHNISRMSQEQRTGAEDLPNVIEFNPHSA